MKSSGQRWLERVLPLTILGLAVVAVPVMLFSPAGLSRLRQLEQERERADHEISELSQRIRELRAEVAAVRQRPEAIERVARDELGLVRKTEVVFHFE